MFVNECKYLNVGSTNNKKFKITVVSIYERKHLNVGSINNNKLKVIKIMKFILGVLSVSD